MTRTIGQVSAVTGLSPSTLRYYEYEGLFIRPIARDSASRRIYSDSDVAWLRTCMALPSTGMDIEDLRRYVSLARLGPGSVTDRLDLLRAHADHVRARIRSLSDDLALIEEKADAYAQRLATEGPERADSSWETRQTHHHGTGSAGSPTASR